MASSKIYTLLALLAVVASAERSLQGSPSPSPSSRTPSPSSRVQASSPTPSPPPFVPLSPPPPVPDCFTDAECFPSDSCKISTCVAGVCIESPFVCTTTNLCLPQVCVSGTCVTDTANSLLCDVSNPCAPQVCDATGGFPTCVLKEVDCDDGNACTKDKCVVTNGLPVCENTADAEICLSADKGDKCYPKVCKAGATPTEYTCEKVPVVCDDDDKCTMDMCNPVDGTCVYKSVCATDTGKKSKMYPGSATPSTASTPSTPSGKVLYASFADYLSGGSPVVTYTPSTPSTPSGKYYPAPVVASTVPAPSGKYVPVPSTTGKTYPAPVTPSPVVVAPTVPAGKPYKKSAPVPSTPAAKTGLAPGDY